MISYMFRPDSDVLDCLMNHIYQKSISEVVLKIMNI